MLSDEGTIQHQILSSNDFWRYSAELSRTAIYEVPIFNIWDSISSIYTLCVEQIPTDLRAELRLFQFRTLDLLVNVKLGEPPFAKNVLTS
jgi:hypothetical protein